MTLDARVVRALGSFRLEIDLTTKSGETVAVLGPNGSGKSTLFRCLAGLLPIDDGAIELDGEVLDDASTGTFVVPERRPVAVVFQDYLLFPSLSALENVAFGLRARNAHHLPRALSGGQAQRVALARALASEPRLLLLDEPLAALDAGTRGDVRRDLRRHLASFDGVRLLVTHDPVDAYALADRVIILERGSVVQAGSLAEVAAQPRSRYVADLVGVNLVRGTGAEGAIITATGGRVIAAEPIQGDAFALIQPHSVALYTSVPEGSPRNVWASIVADIDRQADRVRVRLTGDIPLVAEITPASLDDLTLQPGDHVWASVKATEITAYPA
jgi:molybdate transport system ATP-binding protein